MESNIHFISDLRQFKDILFSMIENNKYSEIVISGTWNKAIYEEILSQIIKNNGCYKCRILIPHMSNDGSLPRTFINKVAGLKGQIRVNNKLNSNMLVVGSNAFAASFSYREIRKAGPKAFFDCCMMTDDEKAVDDIKNRFNEAWENSFPIISEVV